jgi:hypothetical protein
VHGLPAYEMRIYLQHQKTGKYYSEKGTWVKTVSSALSFATVPAAQRHLADNKLESVAIVLKGNGINGQMEVPPDEAGNGAAG